MSRRTWWETVPLAVVGIVLGAVTTLAARPPVTLEGSGQDSPSPAPVTLEATPQKAQAGVLLVWTPGGLPDGLRDAVAAAPQVRDVTVVRGDRVDLVGSRDADGRPVDTARAGWAWPLDALAIEPHGYAAFGSKGDAHAIAQLGPDRALLGSTSADIRRVGPGGTLTVAGGTTLEVAEVVNDTTVAAAELVVDVATGAAIGVTTPRFLLVSHDGQRATAEDEIRRRVPPGTPVRVRAPGETPFLRHGDAVLPQSHLKRWFGEFAYQPPRPGQETFRQDVGWAAANVVGAELPLVGDVRCHRAMVEPLQRALEELDGEGLDHLVDPEGFAGCHNPRLVEPDGAVSRHAWGVAVDLNAAANPTGTRSAQDPRLVDTLTRWGFTWGGFWLVPDPMHFEYRRTPSGATPRG